MPAANNAPFHDNAVSAFHDNAVSAFQDNAASAFQDNAVSAVALAYAQGRGAPRVSAKGRGLIAEEIIRRAKDAGVFVHESRELVGLLMQVDLDRHIPPQLYVVVAELLAWLHRVERGTQNRDNKDSP